MDYFSDISRCVWDFILDGGSKIDKLVLVTEIPEKIRSDSTWKEQKKRAQTIYARAHTRFFTQHYFFLCFLRKAKPAEAQPVSSITSSHFVVQGYIQASVKPVT